MKGLTRNRNTGVWTKLTLFDAVEVLPENRKREDPGFVRGMKTQSRGALLPESSDEKPNGGK